MSTKTTIKRVALVAAVALTLGGFSTVSASAAPSAYIPANGAYDATNGVQVVGGQATVNVLTDTGTTSTVTLTGVGSIVSAVAVDAANDTVTSLTATGFQAKTTSGLSQAQETTTVVLTSAVAGTSTLTIVPLATNGTPGTAVTKTITWTASGSLAVASVSSALVDGVGYLGAATQTLLPLSYDKGSSVANVAGILATVKDGNGNAVNNAAVSVVIAGPGLVSAASGETNAVTAALRATSAYTNASGHVAIRVANDGTAGVATVTITAGTVSTTQSITFTGSAASYVATAGWGTYGVGATNATEETSTTAAFDVKALDANGNVVLSGASVWATSSDKTVATISSAAHTLNTSTGAGLTKGHAYFQLTGIKAGTATITFQNTDPAGTTAPTVTTSVKVTVSTGIVDSVSAAFDKASYLPGQAGTLNLTLKNAAGNPVADGTYTIFSSLAPLSSNVQINANNANATPYASGVSVTTVGGVAALDFFAPVVEGTLTIAGTLQSASTANAALSATNRGAVITASADVASPASAGSSLAVDAANAATDAANAAAEEASNATEAASEALAAVNSLATTVASLIAGIKAQLTALTALVKKLQK